MSAVAGMGAFAGAAAVSAWAPGRVNLIGEHVDYNDGLVLPIAIDRGVKATVSVRGDGAFRVTSRQQPGEVIQVDALVPRTISGWAAYVLGAVWSVAEAAGGGPGLDIDIDGDVPLGAGLSSSAAVECAVAAAVAAAWRVEVAPRELARLAQRAENDFVGVPTGAMDQVASVMAREGCAVLFDVRADTVEHLRLDGLLRDAAFLVIDTRASHELVDGGYAERRAQCEQAAALLGVTSLREVDDLERALALLSGESDVLVRRTRHVVTEIDRVRRARAAIDAGDAQSFGELMDQSHASLRDDFEVSCEELDVAVAEASTAGALGARMTGGGFGGSAITLVPVDRVRQVTERLRLAYETRAWPEPRIWSVTPACGARLVVA